MPAWLLPALFSAGGFGASLFGGSMRRRNAERIARMIRDMQNPSRMLAEANTLYGGMLGSPAFSVGQNEVLGASRQAQSALVGNTLGGGGISGGLNAMKMSMGQALPGMAMAKLRQGFHDQATNITQQNIRDRIAALTGAMGSPSAEEGGLGALMAALGPLLQAYLNRRPGGAQTRDPWGRTSPPTGPEIGSDILYGTRW